MRHRYVPGPDVDEPVVWYEGSGLGTRRWFHANAQGSIIAVSDASAGAHETNKYDPYGNPSTTTGSRFKYTGQVYLEKASLYHYKARAYSSTLGRFLQTDPIGYGDGLNLYAYVGGDPVNYTDPRGMSRCQDEGSCQQVETEEWVVTSTFTEEPDPISYDDWITFNLYIESVTIGNHTIFTATGIQKSIADAQITQSFSLPATSQNGTCSLGGSSDFCYTTVAMVGPLLRAAAKAYVKQQLKNSVKANLKRFMLPTQGKVRFVPPKSWKPGQPLPKGQNGGFIDRHGNEWIKGPGRRVKGKSGGIEKFEWDVQLSRTGKSHFSWASKDGNHLNVSIVGEITH